VARIIADEERAAIASVGLMLCCEEVGEVAKL